TWEDGSLPTFTNWAPGYPKIEGTGGGEDDFYAYMWTTGYKASTWMNDEPNLAADGVICQRAPDSQ
ncbi:hypothetical protein AAVH_39059, partial [Aphelenchoides avenae]